MKALKGKLFNLASILALIFLWQVSPTFAQTYYYNGPVTGGPFGPANGYEEVDFSDLNSPGYIYGNGGGTYAGNGGSLGFGNLNASYTYDPVANTLSFAGVLGVSPASSQVTFPDNQMVNGNFVPGSVTLNYTIGGVNNGNISLGSVSPAAQNGSGQPVNSGPVGEWAFSSMIPVTGSYSLTTGGQTYTGGFSYDLDLNFPMDVSAGNSSGITFVESQQGADFGAGGFPEDIAQVTAANGFVMNLSTKENQDGVTYEYWYVNGGAYVPEPTTLTIFGAGICGLLLLRSRRAPK